MAEPIMIPATVLVDLLRKYNALHTLILESGDMTPENAMLFTQLKLLCELAAILDDAGAL